MYILEKLSSSRIRLFLSKYTEGIGMNDPPSLFDLGCRDMAVTCWRRSDGRRRKWTHDHPACNEQKHKTFIRRQLFSLFFYYSDSGHPFQKGSQKLFTKSWQKLKKEKISILVSIDMEKLNFVFHISKWICFAFSSFAMIYEITSQILAMLE